jgi:hypothetical protein
MRFPYEAQRSCKAAHSLFQGIAELLSLAVTEVFLIGPRSFLSISLDAVRPCEQNHKGDAHDDAEYDPQGCRGLLCRLECQEGG